MSDYEKTEDEYLDELTRDDLHYIDADHIYCPLHEAVLFLDQCPVYYETFLDSYAETIQDPKSSAEEKCHAIMGLAMLEAEFMKRQ